MKDRENNQTKAMQLPPTWCSGLCRNAMNEVCVEDCAVKRDCSAFEPKPNLKLSDMPRFPETKDMTREEKFTSVTIYLSKVVDHLQGVENEQFYFRDPKPIPHRIRSRPLPEHLKVEDLLSNFTEANSSRTDGEVRENQVVGPHIVADKDE